jgi:hypothetical protein
MADHLGLARSAAGAERLAQGTAGRGPIRRLAALAGSLPVHRSFPDFPDFPIQERESRWTTTVVSPDCHATDGGAAEERSSGCQTVLSHDSSDCLVADAKLSSQGAQAPGRDQGANRGLLIGSKTTSASMVPRGVGDCFTPWWPAWQS